MSEKIVLLLLLLFPLSVTALSDSSLDSCREYPANDTICFEGNSPLLMPKMSFPEGTDGMKNFDSLPVYSLNQSIIGYFLLPTNAKANNISVCIYPINLSSYLSGYQFTCGLAGKECAKTSPVSNGSTRSNGTSFQLSSTSSGLNSLNFIDEDKSSVIMSMPLLITKGQMIMQMQSIVNANEPFIQVNLNTTTPGNQSKFFAAIMISRNDYENASLGIAKNLTTNSLDITLSLGSKSLQIQGPPKISSELLMNLLPLLPASSAIGLQESTQSGVDLILMSDTPWVKGEYILTCGIYSPGKGLLGINQSVVEVV